MVEFSKYYMEFIGQLWNNIVDIFKSLFKVIANIFYNDPNEYIRLLLGYSKNNENWNALDWISLVVVSLINIIFVFLLLVMFFQFLRRYLKFVRKEREKDDLIEEVAILNNKVLELIDEKNKILAMKVSQLGLNPQESNRQINFETPAVISKKNKDAKKAEGRFSKLSQIDEKYGYQVYNVHMELTDMVTLEGLVERFINFSASQLRLYYTKETVSLFFAGLATSKVIILEGISGTGKTSLPYAMGKFFKFDTSIISVQPSWRDRAELLGYLNEFTKKFNETDLLASLYEAGYRDDINFIVLDEMNLARIEYYFAEFLSVMEMPDINEWKIDLVPKQEENDPKLLINGKILVPQNLWFVGTANKDDSTFTITDKVYDRAVAIELNNKARFVDAPYTEPVDMSYEYLDGLFAKAKKEFEMSDKILEKFAVLDEYIQENFKIAFGNRIMRQIKIFVPVYVGCGNTEVAGLDYIFMTKILRKFEALNLAFLKPELEELINKIDSLFGKGAFKSSIEFIENLIKMN